MRIAIYPGTFDPITYGHIDIIERAKDLFDKVIVAIARNSAKKPLFTHNERVRMIEEVVRKYRNVEVDSFDGLTVRYATLKHATAIVRGLRAVSDFEYEFQMALTNRKLAEKVTTVFLMPHEKYTYMNSSIVREIALLGGDTSGFIPQSVQMLLTKKVKQMKKRR